MRKLNEIYDDILNSCRLTTINGKIKLFHYMMLLKINCTHYLLNSYFISNAIWIFFLTAPHNDKIGFGSSFVWSILKVIIL